jgi:hypothetical protein
VVREMTDGSAVYSIGLRKVFEEKEISCINMGGLNEDMNDFRQIRGWGK